MTPLIAVSQSSSRLLVEQIGFGPMTLRLSDEVSTTELLLIKNPAGWATLPALERPGLRRNGGRRGNRTHSISKEQVLQTCVSTLSLYSPITGVQSIKHSILLYFLGTQRIFNFIDLAPKPTIIQFHHYLYN